MPVDFLSAAQAAAYGRYAEPPSVAQLERFFHFDERDRTLIERRRGDHNRLGFAVQLGTVRFLGTFLARPTEVPEVVARRVADEVRVRDPACLADYAQREPTHREHAGEIQREYGCRDFSEQTAQAERRRRSTCSTTATTRTSAAASWPSSTAAKAATVSPATSATAAAASCAKPYRDGQEEQLNALGLIVNTIVLYNTIYTQRAIDHILAITGNKPRDEDVERLSPLGSDHITLTGRYRVLLPAPLHDRSAYRALNTPKDAAAA